MAKAGELGSPPPTRVILEMADWSIGLLFWLAGHQRENIKKYARTRWAWPAYVHLLKREQGTYEEFLPKFNKTGTKVVQPSPIDLGADLPFHINANLTKGDLLFRVAANAIIYFSPIHNRELWHDSSWLWLPSLHPPLLDLKREAYESEANKFFESLGKMNRSNWVKWRPVFDGLLTFRYGLPKHKFELMPVRWRENLHLCLQHGTHLQWFENSKKIRSLSAEEKSKWLSDLESHAKSSFYDKKPPLQELDQPVILEIVNRSKKPDGKWTELKDEILKRIYNLIHPA